MIRTPTSEAKKSEQQNQQVELINPSYNTEDTTTLNLNETAEQTAIIQEMSTKGFSSIKNRMKQRVLKVLETPDQLFSPKAYLSMNLQVKKAKKMFGEEDINAIWSRKHTSNCTNRVLCCLCIEAPHEKQKTGRCSCSYLLPRFFLSLFTCIWIINIVIAIVNLTSEDNSLQDVISFFATVAFFFSHIYSLYTVIQTAQDGTIGRRYCLAEELMDDKIEKKDLKVRREWSIYLLLWIGTLIFFAISELHQTWIEHLWIGFNRKLIEYVLFTVLYTYIVLPSFILNGVMDARTYDLLSNTKMVYMLTEKLFDQVDETGKTNIDGLEFSNLLNTVRKLVGAIQMFSVSSNLVFSFYCYVQFFTDFLLLNIFSFLFYLFS
mgnify:CR=1 FL=1